ncbi:MAG: vacuolar H+transporting two-sector ATPase F subunit [Thaumarchaeota archaeon]|nr:vacuolar H+transporting two-sector ATPase F subunit [Candidatus Calditenuaceae archaeon]MDW8041930.1 V-type ATP synthase subunit F [Nitrososphaerota archaeon]
MRVVAVGGEAFVSAMRLAGAGTVQAGSPEEALAAVSKLVSEGDVGLILVSDEYGQEFSQKLSELRAAIAVPVIYLLPAPGSKVQPVDYRAVIRQVLGV